MDKKLKIKLRASREYSFLQLTGIIDEDNNLSKLLDRITGTTLILDLSEIHRINSCGVRDWVNWLNAVEARNLRIVLIRCSPAIISQVNMVTNFAGESVIQSFMLPYYCSECDEETTRLIETRIFLEQEQLRAPLFRCNDCGNSLEFDDFEESYFSFIETNDYSKLTARIRKYIEEIAPGIEKKIQALNRGSITPLSGPIHTAPGLTLQTRPQNSYNEPIPEFRLSPDEPVDPMKIVERIKAFSSEEIASVKEEEERIARSPIGIYIALAAVMVVLTGLLILLVLNN